MDNIKTLIEEFRDEQKREEEIIEEIRKKTEIFDFKDKPREGSTMNRVCEVLCREVVGE